MAVRGFRRFHMHFLLKLNKTLNNLLTIIGGLCLVGMIVLTCANIFIRQIYMPISGTFELMGFTGAVVTAFALGYTQLGKGHIAVDVLVNVYPKSLKKNHRRYQSWHLLPFFLDRILAYRSKSIDAQECR